MSLFWEIVLGLIVFFSIIAIVLLVGWVASRIDMGKLREDRPDLFDKDEEN